MWKKWLLLFILICSTAASCNSMRTKGGSTIHQSATGAKTELVQSELPNKSSFINTSSKITEKLIIPPSATISIPSMVSHVMTNGNKVFTNNVPMVVFLPTNSQPIIIERTIEDKVNNEIGSSWKDAVGETIAKLKSLTSLKWIGAIFVALGIGSLSIPWLRAFINSTTTSACFIICGFGMMMLPILLVGHEVMIILILSGVAIGWFFIYRYSQASTKAKVYKDFIDANKDGVDDRTQ